MSNTNTLPLRDIHLPADIAWWPPAIGWWFVAGLILLSIAITLWLYRRKQRRQLYNAALQELTHIQRCHEQKQDNQILIQSLSIWLRRVCISHYPAVDIAGLTGNAWLKFLDKNMTATSTPQAFSQGAGKQLLSAPYQNTQQQDNTELLSLCRTWLNGLPKQYRKIL